MFFSSVGLKSRIVHATELHPKSLHFWDSGSLHSPDWPETHYAAQASFKLLQIVLLGLISAEITYVNYYDQFANRYS